MTDITTRQAYSRPPSRVERHADAIHEMRTMHSDYEVLQHHCEEQRRMIERLTDRNNLLLDQLRTSQQHERIVTNKLIRLATAMASIGKLSQEADEIIRSTREWQQDEAEHGGQSHITNDEDYKMED